jgi:tripeptide aminopeptidase
MKWALMLAVVGQLGIGTPAYSQSPDQLIGLPQVRRALDYLWDSEPETINEQIKTCEIPAPPFKEQVRAEYYKQRFTELRLRNVRIDGEGNVIGERPGAESQPVLVISAHLDTVFPEGPDVKVKRDGSVLKGPGVGDDCRGLAILLAVARALEEARIESRGMIVFVATVGEEGLGNLRGARQLLMEEMKGKVTHFVSVDCPGFRIINREIGSNRYRVTFHGPGGHSWGAFGLPSPIHALGRAVEKVSRFAVPRSPKTIFNVGQIGGGTSVNSIAHTAWMEVDLRSESAEELAKVDTGFKRAVQAGLDEENAFWAADTKLTVDVKQIGERPVGKQAPDAPIVRTVLSVDAALGINSEPFAASTDSGMAMRLGIPAITIGDSGRWHGEHSLEESFDTRDSHLGTQRAFLLTLAITGLR